MVLQGLFKRLLRILLCSSSGFSRVEDFQALGLWVQSTQTFDSSRLCFWTRTRSGMDSVPGDDDEQYLLPSSTIETPHGESGAKSAPKEPPCAHAPPSLRSFGARPQEKKRR